MDLQRDFWTEAVAGPVPELPDSDRIARYRLGNRIPCVGGTPGAATPPFAEELPGEPVVTKRSFDGFLGTDIDAALAERGARGLLLAGLVTSTCALFTAATATQRGYLVKSCRTADLAGPRCTR